MEHINNTTNSTTHNVHLAIEKNWDGKIAERSERASVIFCVNDQQLGIQIEAPFHGDPPPSAPAGEFEGLWNYEVVELFLLGTNGHYLEIEIGPHAHFLIYHLCGIRQVARTLSPALCKTRIAESGWEGSLTLSLDQSILPFSHVNAYAIHGQGADRRYLSTFPVPGKVPDFHQPGYFGYIGDL